MLSLQQHVVVCHVAPLLDEGLCSEQQGLKQVSRTQPYREMRQSTSTALCQSRVPSEFLQALGSSVLSLGKAVAPEPPSSCSEQTCLEFQTPLSPLSFKSFVYISNRNILKISTMRLTLAKLVRNKPQVKKRKILIFNS